MTEFKNGDVLRSKKNHDKEVVFIGVKPSHDSTIVCWCCYDEEYSEYFLGHWELKPRKEKRWIAVFPDDYVYPIPHRDKNTLVHCVTEEHVTEYVKSAQYIEIEVEV